MYQIEFANLLLALRPRPLLDHGMDERSNKSKMHRDGVAKALAANLDEKRPFGGEEHSINAVRRERGDELAVERIHASSLGVNAELSGRFLIRRSAWLGAKAAVITAQAIQATMKPAAFCQRE
jgi:hypothetical protein